MGSISFGMCSLLWISEFSAKLSFKCDHNQTKRWTVDLTLPFVGAVCCMEVWQLNWAADYKTSFVWSVDQILGIQSTEVYCPIRVFQWKHLVFLFISTLSVLNISISSLTLTVKVKVKSTVVNKYEVQTSRYLHRLCNLSAPDLMTNMNRCKF